MFAHKVQWVLTFHDWLNNITIIICFMFFLYNLLGIMDVDSKKKHRYPPLTTV
jgi:hypothetical protein